VSTLDLIILSACAIGACTDIASKRIPNVLTICTALIALAFHATLGLPSLALCLLTMTLIGAAGFFLFSFRLIGGGDVKLIAAVGGALSFPACLPFLLYTMLAGGVLALVVAAARGTFKESCSAAFSAAHPLLYRTGNFYLPAVTGKIPYGVAIFSGAALAILSTTFLPNLRLPL
jgi:prepilin peptidase CpaA